MILIPKNRRWVAGTVFLLVANLGAMTGYLLGRGEVLRAAENGLAQDASRVIGMLGALIIESQEMLAVMNTSPYGFCSDEEIAWFRRLAYHAVNLRDVGRMRDGRIQCSTVFGRENLPETPVYPRYSYLDGISLYIDLPLHVIPGTHSYARQLGNSFVVEDPNFSLRFQVFHQGHDFVTTNVPREPDGYPQGFHPKVPGVIADRDAVGRVGDALYATRCLPRSFSCVISYASVSASLHSAQRQLALDSAVGGLSGGFLVLVFVLVYQRNRSIGAQLRRAIRKGQLRMVYQPVVELSTGRIVQAEALARWTDEDGFVVSPEIFVRIAEEMGFVGDLTAFVVRQVLCDQGEILRSRQDFRISINVTAFDLIDPKFLAGLATALAEAQVEPRQLAIELTESSTANSRVAVETLRQLHDRGHCVQIDDFGTGYSSLSYLKDLAVDTIKIDKSFTQAISTEAVIGAILPQILMLAEALGLEVIVEGIESKEQADFFRSFRPPVMGQGWYFGKPLPAREFLLAFAEQERNRLAQVDG